jgi:phosphopantothenoylcysteine decarboxylase/phosphopantothenate--cysteine ligase
MESGSLLVIATGSSASIVLSSYLTELRSQVAGPITVLMTTSAERFVRPEVVGWFADHVLTCDTPGLNPIQLALTARAIVVLPASANTLSSAALGLAATPAQTALLAAPWPVLYFPHMNPVMWSKPVIQRHVAGLRADGDTVVAPVETTTYHMWKGAKDVGLSLPDPEDAAAIVDEWLLGRPPVVAGETA